MKTRILVSAVMLLIVGGVAYAQAPAPELHGYFDLTYSSKYVWRGFDIYNDKSAVHPGVDLNYGGFGINVTGHRANAGGFENGERWDYNLYYANGLFMDQSYALQYRLGWVYYNFPDNSSGLADLQEAHLILSLPKICPAGVIPSYVLVKLWPSESGSMVASKADLSTGLPSTGTASGWAHIFMLDYALTTGGLLPETPEQVWNFHTEAVFNDGVGPGGQDVDHDWSNVVFGVSTDFDLAENVVLTPGLYHQITFDDSVNDDKDETWVSVGIKYKF
ncbi:MAG: hypothetical protein A2Z25_10795 [Planctomycetes bacterium RBG_16_55_9]|nr:MAG: hypothetical protein A2Z25_10795 [Planctomycetes bacterium RBG_16_55_9]